MDRSGLESSLLKMAMAITIGMSCLAHRDTVKRSFKTWSTTCMEKDAQGSRSGQGQALGANRVGDQKGTAVDERSSKLCTCNFDMTCVVLQLILQRLCGIGPVSRLAEVDAMCCTFLHVTAVLLGGCCRRRHKKAPGVASFWSLKTLPHGVLSREVVLSFITPIYLMADYFFVRSLLSCPNAPSCILRSESENKLLFEYLTQRWSEVCYHICAGDVFVGHIVRGSS